MGLGLIEHLGPGKYTFCVIVNFGKILCTFTSSDICTAFGVLKDVNTSNQYKQGTNARKVISEVYAFIVLQFTVFGRKSKHKTDTTA